MCIRTVSIYR